MFITVQRYETDILAKLLITHCWSAVSVCARAHASVFPEGVQILDTIYDTQLVSCPEQHGGRSKGFVAGSPDSVGYCPGKLQKLA